MLDQPNVTGSGRHDLDIWHVRLADGATRALSLDELDAGFQAGWISESTMVLRAGSLRWAPLSEVAGDAEQHCAARTRRVPRRCRAKRRRG